MHTAHSVVLQCLAFCTNENNVPSSIIICIYSMIALVFDISGNRYSDITSKILEYIFLISGIVAASAFRGST
jgi:hypothetical protein